MADRNYFAHNSQDGRSPWDRANQQGISANGENIAAGSSTAQGTLNQWKNSDGHCRNIMNPSFSLFAVGYGFNSASTYRHYWTQMFKTSDVSLDESCYSGLSVEFDIVIEATEEMATPSNVDEPWSSDKLAVEATKEMAI
jgi:hypothetical protein